MFQGFLAFSRTIEAAQFEKLRLAALRLFAEVGKRAATAAAGAFTTVVFVKSHHCGENRSM
ncbi:hypothetical protein N7530_005818 [Penicillium desertorum]|uniref:Uncharacterized protein n=1 Tax=Penicillium desertorum TaxID=1303715 RepID=A0A9W9X0P5_9EURO|nr:hypothetical protein N7530_005818 [Penicillium desertorum]